MQLEPGHVLNGTLRLIRKVAQGGMGSVWIAEHLVLGTEVAVKFMARPWSSVPAARTRFLREARMTAKIDSPHVVRVLDCRFSEADEPYLVLELLHGEDLEQRVRRHGPLSVQETVEIIAQACEALSACHEAGIIHRDLKPENVFLVAGERPLVKILDFGIAKPTRLEDAHESDKLAAGTPQYMSPEQMFEPEKTDARSDLFALAAVAYFALTRRPPFQADTIEGLYLAIDGGKFTKASELRPELPPELDAWFDKALATEPTARFASAREMASALYDAFRAAQSERATLVDADDLPLSQRADATQGELRPDGLIVPMRRFRRPMAVAAAAAAALVVGFFAWHDDGPQVTEAVASPEYSDAGIDGRNPTPPTNNVTESEQAAAGDPAP